MTLSEKLKRRVNKFKEPRTLAEVIKHLQKNADLGMSNALVIRPLSERKRLNRLAKDLTKLGLIAKVFQHSLTELMLEVEIT